MGQEEILATREEEAGKASGRGSWHDARSGIRAGTKLLECANYGQA